MREDLIEFCREAPVGESQTAYASCLYQALLTQPPFLEFTEHQRTVFCVFSGDGVNRLRNYLNTDPQSIYDTEGTMYDDREITDGDNDQQVASLMNMAGINDDEDGEEDPEVGEGSQFGGEAEGI